MFKEWVDSCLIMMKDLNIITGEQNKLMNEIKIKTWVPVWCSSTTILAAFLAVLLGGSIGLRAYTIAEKSRERRIEMVQYLRLLRPMVLNFPCEPLPECLHNHADEPKGPENNWNRYQKYRKIKRIYGEGMIYFFQGDYTNAYNRLLDAQRRTELLLEDLSKFYLDRGRVFLRESIEKKREKDPSDKTAVDVSVEYGPLAYRRNIFSKGRITPQQHRRYDPKELRWANHKFRIEKNIEKGYDRIRLAQKARTNALKVEKAVSEGFKMTPLQRKLRIEYYLASIFLARMAKMNAGFIYALKYPYDNYALYNKFTKTERGVFDDVKTPTIEGVRMSWYKNPYLRLGKLNPVFDLRVPSKYRRDLSDAKREVYSEQVDEMIRLKFLREKPPGFEAPGEEGASPPVSVPR